MARNDAQHHATWQRYLDASTNVGRTGAALNKADREFERNEPAFDRAHARHIRALEELRAIDLSPYLPAGITGLHSDAHYAPDGFDFSTLDL